MALTWKTKWKWNTGYSADSVEWCPVVNYRHVLVCGTYQLEKKDEAAEQATKQQRLGRIYLFVIDSTTTELTPVQTVNTSGILDQKWCYHLIQDHPVLAVVTSEGIVQLYRLVKDEEFNLQLWLSYKLDEDVLALSVDWSTNKVNSDDVFLVVSDSSGRVTLLRLSEDLEKVGEWKSHDYEAWIVGFNYWNQTIFYSGGDDCLFKCYDSRLLDPVSTSRTHDAGVTAIRSHVEVEHQLLTGSYDEKVRIWDTRNLKRCVSERDVNGGVWRLKWHPYHKNTILAACMYGGFRILNVTGVTDSIEVVSEYLEHDSIAYGADWRCSEESLVATCSFYDCQLHISEIEL
ncbi:diphthine methyltransferase isoform X1 [Amyelois transitella]|nr:diphthine methyltransferase isoform X1 [Amyelois transitella]